MDKTIQNILVTAANSSAAIHELYRFSKQRNPRFSLAQICKKAGISSTGYLSDVMSGKRVLNRKYRESIAQSFNLGNLAQEYLVLLVEIDHSKDPLKTQALNQRIEGLKRAMGITMEAIPRPFQEDMLFYLIVFSAFSLFQNQPRREDLIEYFGKSHERKIDEALNHLRQQGFITGNEDRFYYIKNRVFFNDSEDGFSHTKFLRAALEDAKTKLGFWYDRPTEAHLESSIISINSHEYRQKLPKIRAKLLELQTELEGDQADSLLRFNVQIYPEKPLKSP